ncbi:hypothetical protein [Nocardia sp. NBC_01327]|uniref:hypothetical protein n=1 Tax=Nocardia sp. NBC_01327 TaxID=2903593 RepID=UPI002E12D7FA|nr:hypothetical protein OG326_22445 [Nocardia sp. NBC_01327]
MDARFSSPPAGELAGSESAAQRFGRWVKTIRLRNLPDELITHQQIHDLGGPTRNVQSRIEGGHVHSISATTEAKYNRALEALGLPAGSATSALHQGRTPGPGFEGSDGSTTEPDDVEHGVRALQRLNREHRSVVDLVTELDRLGIELKNARSHSDGYQLTFASTAIHQLLEALQRTAGSTGLSDQDHTERF